MARSALFFLLLLPGLATLTGRAATGGFEGIWTGEILAPNTRTPLGLAFTRTEKGLLVSLDFPEMFLRSVNFGPADIRDGTFTLAPLNLTLRQDGDALTGTFAPAQLPVELKRGGTFPEPSPLPPPPPAPAPLWTRSLGVSVWASPVAHEGFVYVGAVDGSFHAFRASDGETVWTWRGTTPLYGEALVTTDAVYFVDDHTDLLCLARPDGTLRWRLPLHDTALAGGPPPNNETFNHRTATPVIDAKGILYVGSTDRGLYAVRAKTGRVVWRHDARARIFAPVTLRGDQLFATCFDGSVFQLDRRTRREKFRVKLGGALVSAPVLAGDRLIVGSRDYLLYGLDASNGEVRWRNSFWFSWIESTPRLVDGTLYIGSSDFRRVSAIDPANGSVRWATDVGGLSWGSPLVMGGQVFAATAGQHLAGTVIEHTGGLVALGRATGAAHWRHLAPASEGATFTGITGSLVGVDDRVIAVGVDGQVVAFPSAKN